MERAGGRGRALHSGPWSPSDHMLLAQLPRTTWVRQSVVRWASLHYPHYLLRMPVVSTLLIQIPPRFAKSSCLLITIPAPLPTPTPAPLSGNKPPRGSHLQWGCDLRSLRDGLSLRSQAL